MKLDEDKLREAFSRIPLLNEVDLEKVAVQRLGGLTNHNHHLVVPGKGEYVLRLAGPGTEDYINRRAEKHNAQVASDADVNVRLHFFDEADGLMLTEYVPAETMSIESFKDLSKVQRAGVAFRKLHDCSTAFQGDFELFEQIDMYLGVLEKLNSPIPEGFHEVKALAGEARVALLKWELPKVPSHCDPLYENFLDTGERMYIIDFEYGGNNDPMWDLGDLSVEAEFNKEQDRVLLESYFGGAPKPFDEARMVMYKGLCDVLWTLWGVVQHANGNPADDFWTYSVNRLKRGQELMLSPEFAKHLEIVKSGPS